MSVCSKLVTLRINVFMCTSVGYLKKENTWRANNINYNEDWIAGKPVTVTVFYLRRVSPPRSSHR